jgi:hypothetical protein
MDARVSKAVALAVSAVGKAHPELRLGSVAVNTASEQGINVNVVRDARRGETDAAGCPKTGETGQGTLDDVSVRGICTATSSRIDCAEGALRALAGDQEPSLALVLVLLHELGHVALGHAGTFVEEQRVIDLSRSRQAKVSHLANLCFTDEHQLDLELRADAFAQAALEEVVKAPPFYDPLASAAGSVGLATAELQPRFDALAEWATTRAKSAVEPVVLDEKTVCDVLARRQGSVMLPVLRGSHPSGKRRMADLTTRLAGRQRRLSTRPEVDDTHPAAALGNAQQLMGGMTDILGALDRQDAEAGDEISDAFCREVSAVEVDRARCH